MLDSKRWLGEDTDTGMCVFAGLPGDVETKSAILRGTLGPLKKVVTR